MAATEKTYELPQEAPPVTSGALAAPFADLVPEFERLSGHKVVTILGSSQGGAPDSIPERLKRGEAAHVVLLGRESLDALVKGGAVKAGTERDIVASRMALSVRLGIPKPDISTLDGFKTAMLEAKSIAYSASVSGTYLSTEGFQKLGIADQVLPKAMRIVSERVGAVLTRNEADIGIQQISELIPFARPHSSSVRYRTESRRSLCFRRARRPMSRMRTFPRR